MGKLLKVAIVLTLLINQTIADTYIQGEETTNKFIKVKEVARGEYKFDECILNSKTGMKCTALLKNDPSFRRFQLREIVEKNERNMAYAIGADIAIVAASLYFGWILAAKATASYYVAAGVSLDGGVAAAGGALWGTSGAAVVSTTVTVAIDELDPFVHRDMSIAFEEALDEADDDDLEDVEAKKKGKDTYVVIEDITYDQLKNKIKNQLEWASKL